MDTEFENSSKLTTNCVDSPYPIADTAHRISINLEMYHCVAKVLFCSVY